MKPKNILSIAGIVTALLSACSPVFYTPPSQQVPLLTHEKEFTASGSYMAGGSVGGFGVKAAYALSPHVAVLGSAHGFVPGAQKDKDASSGSGGIVDMGAGYFTPFSDKFVFETYGFLGYGWMKNSFPGSIASHPGTDGLLSAALYNVAVQPSIGYKSKYFEAAFSTKMGMVSYNGIKGNLVTKNSSQTVEGNQQDYLKANKNNFMIEPALTVGGGWESLKLQAQFGLSLNANHNNFPQDKHWISIGISYRVPRK